MSSTSETGLTLSPYPGLRPFRRDEADVFFGREQQVDQLLAKLETCRFLTVVGVSGCGKSSLVRAGMLSALESGFMASAGPRWHVVEMRPGGHPLANLAQAILTGDTLDEEWKAGPDADAFVRAVLRRGPLGLVELLRESLQPKRNNLLLLVDQFEEIFRFHQHGDSNEATAFIDLLLESAKQAEVPIYVVLTMRSDFLGDCSIFSGLPEAINDGQFLIPRLSREQCRAAVVGPAAAFGSSVQPELVNHVLNDIGSNPDQLPLLQHALMRIWTRTAEKTDSPRAEEDGLSDEELTLSLAEYETVGGLKNALSNHADELYESLASDDRRVAETLYRCLSERGADGRDIRRPVPLEAVAAVAQVPPETIIRIVDVFREPTCSFLTPPSGVPLHPDTVLDISHESLIRQWHHMENWVQAEADSAAIYRRLHQTAILWKMKKAALWDTPDLENALAWRDREQPNAAWAKRYGGRFAETMTFLNASVDAHERREREENERQERERELLQNMAQAEKQRADDAEERRKEQSQANVLLKRRAVTALAAGVISILLAIVAFVLFAQARAQQEKADEARKDAEVAKGRADELASKEAAARKKSQKAELAALAASNSAFSSLGRANLAQLRSLWNSNELGRQLKALQLLRDSATLRGNAISNAAKQDEIRNQLTRRYWAQLTPQFREQAVRWLSLTSLQQIHRLSFEIPRSTYSAQQSQFALSPDGKRLAIFKPNSEDQNGDGILQTVEPLTGNIIATAKWPANSRRTPLGLGFSPDGQTLFVGIGGASVITSNPVFFVERRSTTDLKLRKTVTLRTGSLRRIYSYNNRERHWFNRQGTRFVYSGYGGAAVWDLATGKRLFADANVRAAKWSNLENRLVVIPKRSSRVRIVDLKDRKMDRQFPLAGSASSSDEATCSPDGKWLAVTRAPQYSSSGYYERPLMIVNLATGEKVSEVRLASSSSSSSSQIDVAFHPSRPVMMAISGNYVSVISVPQGGILYQSRISDAPDAGRRSFVPHHVQFNRRGDLLMTVLRDNRYYSSSSGNRPVVQVQFWDPSVASTSLQTLSLQGAVQDIRFLGDHALAVAGGDRNRTGVQIRPLAGEQQWATRSIPAAGDFEPSGKHFVHVLPDRVDILDAATGKRLKSVPRIWPGYSGTLPVDKNHRWIVGVDRSGKSPQLRLFDATNLTWGKSLIGADSTLSAINLGDNGKHITVRSLKTASRATPVSSRTRYATVVYRTSDGAKLFESPKFYNDSRVTESGYLLTNDYERNEYVFRAIELKTGRVTSEYRMSSSGYSQSLRSRFWLSSDAKTAAFGRRDGSYYRLYLWPFAQGKEPKPLPFQYSGSYTRSVILTNDRLLLAGRVRETTKTKSASSRLRYAVQLWNVKTGKRVMIRYGRYSQAFYLSEKYGKTIVYRASSATPNCIVWDLKTGQTLQTISEYPRGLSPDGRFAVFSSGKVLDLSNMKLRSSPVGSIINAFQFSPNSRHLVYWSTRDGGTKAWVLDLHNPKTQWAVDQDVRSVYRVAISPDSRLVSFIDRYSSQTLQLFDLATGKKQRTISTRHGSFRPEKPAGAKPQRITPGDEPRPVRNPLSLISSLRYSRDGRHFAVVSSDQIRLGRMDRPRVHTALPRSGHRQIVHSVAVSPDRRFIASCSSDRTVCFWRATDGRFLGMLEEGGSSNLRRVVFSPVGNLIATRKENGEIVVWKWSRPQGDDAEISAITLWSNTRGKEGPLAFSPDGRTLAAGDTDGSVRLFDATTQSITHWLTPRGDTGAVRGLAFTPSGKHLAVARGHIVALWDVPAVSLFRAWDAKQGPIYQLASPKDGRFLVTAGKDVRLWNSRTGSLQLKLDKKSSVVRHASVSDSGQRLAFAVDARSVVVTNISDLIKAVEALGLKWSYKSDPSDTGQTAWNKPLWTTATRKAITAENTLVEFLPKALKAERDRNWKQAVSYLTRLIEIDPKNMNYRQRRAFANTNLKNWPDAAVDMWSQFEQLPANPHRRAQRSRNLDGLLRRQPELFAAMEKYRPKETLFALVRGRDFIRQSKWNDARKAYGSVIRDCPVSEPWFEFAALCLITGDRKEYDAHMDWMVKQRGVPKVRFNSYVFARTAGMVPDSRIPSARSIAWGEFAVGGQKHPWFLHVLGLANFRNGDWDKARSAIETALQGRWGAHVLNRLLLGMIEYQSGNFGKAKDLLDNVREWKKGIESRKKDGYVSVQEPDWVEFHVLLVELEALIAKGPRIVKPVEAPKPFRAGQTVIVTPETALLQDGTTTVATVKKGEPLPVVKLSGDRIWTVVDRAGKQKSGWIGIQQIAKYSGWGLRFDGVDDFALVPGPGIELDKFKTFTLESWVRDWKYAILCQGGAGDPENSYWLSIGPKARVDQPHESSGWESGKGANFQFATGVVSRGKWYHIALVYDGSNQTLFVNGKLVDRQKAPPPGPLNNTRRIYLGAHDYRNRLWFGSGVLDAVRISKTARYRSDFHPVRRFTPDANTELLYHLDEGKGETLHDASGKKRHATIDGAKWVPVN